jgi:DNA-binding CsgD family transcriptional regulator
MLTERERDVMELAAKHWPVKKIAIHLNITESTVLSLMEHAAARLGCRTREQAIYVYATGRGR